MNLNEIISKIKCEKDVEKLLRSNKLILKKDKLIRSKAPYFFSKYEKNLSGKNKDCWCGSGLHKDDCHFRFFTVENPKIKLQNYMKSFFDSVEICLKPDNLPCNDIIKAHSIHKGSMFNLLKDNSNHVYRIDTEGEIIKEGHKKASIFFGMCKYHDEILFNQVFENNGFTGSGKEIFMTHYRAIIFELYRKLCLYKMYEDPFIYLECNKNKESRIVEKLLTINESLINKLSLLDYYSEYLKSSQLYQNEKWDEVSSVSFYIKDIPIIGITGMFIPYYDIIRKNIVQKDSPKLLDKIAITSHIYNKDSFIIIFTFSKNSDIAHNFIKPILKLEKEKQKFVLFNVLLEEISNTFMKNTWIENLDENDRHIINEMSKTLTNRKEPNKFIKNVTGVKWNIFDIKVNI